MLAQSDLTTAYNSAAGRTPATTVSGDLGGRTLTPGVYKSASSMGLTGTVRLDAANDPAAVFIFQAGSTLITASNSTVQLIRGAQPCNVFWQVGSSATLGTNTTFVGTVMALTSATLVTGANVSGRILARNGSVTLDSNTVTRPTSCITPTPGSLPQYPVNPVTNNPVTQPLPGHIKFHGTTTLVKPPGITNAVQPLKVSVICRLDPNVRSTRGDYRLCVLVKGPNGGWRIKTFGIHHLVITVTVRAPARGSFAAYRYAKTYRFK